jgi:hypothetical protein
VNISNWDIRRLSFWLGVVTYITSFFVVAVAVGGFRGYDCAYLSLAIPLAEIRDRFTGRTPSLKPLETLSLVASGLVNPAFVLFAVTSRLRTPRGTARLSQILTVALIPFSVIFFFVVPVGGAVTVPKAGYYLWLVGMFLVFASYKS